MINIIKREGVYFLTSLMFFTRIPIPFRLPYNAEIMNQSQKYYAWVGLLVGTLNAICFAGSFYLFNDAIAIVLMMGISVLLTGAFHEDGFADVCDSFGGGYSKDKILTIMKDSRIGAYGTIGILLLLLLKFLALLHLFQIATFNYFILIIIFSHSLSRFVSGAAIYQYDYVTDIDTSKVKPIANKALSKINLLPGILAIIIPIIFIKQYLLFLVIPIALVTQFFMMQYFKKHIGGYTGDCLGAIQQVCEVVIYLTAIVLWQYI